MPGRSALTDLTKVACDAVRAMLRQGGAHELPSERVLAKRIGVSRAVLRRALKRLTDEGLLDPALGKRRRRAASAEAKRVRGRGARALIGIFLAREDDFLFQKLLKPVTGTIIRDGAQVLVLPLFNGDAPDESENQVRDDLPPLDGILSISLWAPAFMAWLERFACPVVVMDHISASRRFVDLVPDEAAGFEKLMGRFRKQGFRTVHYLDFRSDDWNPVRRDAFIGAAHKLGVRVGKRAVLTTGPGDVDAAREALARFEPGSGIFAASPSLCRPVLRALEASGRRCPKDHGFAAGGDEPLHDEGFGAVTTLHIDRVSAAQSAYEILKELKAHPERSRQRRTFPVGVVAGETL